jgi:hypothetical protein
MERLRRRQREEAIVQPPPAIHAEPLAEAVVGPVGPATVEVTWGPITEHMAVGGMSVAEVRTLLQHPYNIPPHAATLVNGRAVTAEHRLHAGDVLEFARASGEKGGGG